MRRFLITHPKFTGSAEVQYNSDGQLFIIDLSSCIIPADVLRPFKNAIPVDVNTMVQGAWAEQAIIIEKDFDVTFEMFWTAYDKKINRLRAEAAWHKLSKTEQVLAFYGIKKYDAFLKVANWRKKADPENYLKTKYWENEWK